MEVGGGPVYSVIFGWYQKRYFLKVFCVAQLSHFQVILGWENFGGAAGRGGSLCTHWHFWCAGFSSDSFRIYDKTKTCGNDRCVGPRKLRPLGIVPVVQWLRPCASTAGGVGQSLAGVLRPHMPWTQPQGFSKAEVSSQSALSPPFRVFLVWFIDKVQSL